MNGRLLTLGVDGQALTGADLFDVIETVIADAASSGALAAHQKLGEAIQRQVALTPDRATWGMDIDDPAWRQPAALPAGEAPVS